jgi:hypothetical protein
MFTAGVVNLSTREFYEQARAHLAPDGVLMNWMPTGNMTIDDERQMFRAMWEVFPYATLWWQLRGGCGLMVGTPAPLRIDYQRLKAHDRAPGAPGSHPRRSGCDHFSRSSCSMRPRSPSSCARTADHRRSHGDRLHGAALRRLGLRSASTRHP